MRGEAFAAAHRYADAAAEFQKILEHRGIVGADPLAHEDFLTRWKDADSDVPILVQAKAEYARLH